MDRGFLRGIEDDKAAAGIASAVVAMSHSLGFDVVAEGVDSERQSKLLAEMNCDQIQGFLYSPPVPASEAARFLATVGSPRPRMDSTAATPQIDKILSAEDSASFGRKALVHQQATPMEDKESQGPPPATRALVIDDAASSLGPIALRMLRLGADTHMVQNIDEASLFIRQEEPLIDMLVVSPDIDLDRLGSLREALSKLNRDRAPRVLVVGDELSDKRRLALRSAAVDWLLLGHAEDSELRSFIAASRLQGGAEHVRRSIRVPLETTAWIRVGGRRQIGTPTNLSRRGAFVETEDPYEVGQSIRLEFKVGEKRICVFGSVTYRHEVEAEAVSYRPPGIGVIFFEPERDTEDDIGEIIERVWNRHLP